MTKKSFAIHRKNYIVYLITFGISILASLRITLSYPLLNIFLPQEKLPLELGVAITLGEQNVYSVNVIIDAIIWFILLILIYGIYKKLRPKKFFIFLILSPFIWMIGTYTIALAEIFIFNNFKIDIFGSSCSGTGYPIARNVCQENILYGFYFLNIFFWFLVIWGFWKVLPKLFKRS